jgi:hypothetical protein
LFFVCFFLFFACGRFECVGVVVISARGKSYGNGKGKNWERFGEGVVFAVD